MFRSTTTLTTIAMLFGFGMHAAVAAPFQNLDFENANVYGTSPGSSIALSQALPYWTANTGGTARNYASYDSIAMDGAAVSVQDGGAPQYGWFPGMSPLQGSYSLMLQCRNGSRAGVRFLQN